MASIVESYFCKACNKEVRFPRYNNVCKLLESRNGRCGEWANCFTGLVRSLGHDARQVHDLTDHVWTEVFIITEDRWAHMDSCENAYDAPKMYEKGWGKKLTYCFSATTEEVVDVTQRYIINPYKNKVRRITVPEVWLEMAINDINLSLVKDAGR